MIFQWSKGIVSPQKNMEGPLYKYFYKLWGTVLRGGLIIRSCQGLGSFTNAFSSNLKIAYKS